MAHKIVILVSRDELEVTTLGRAGIEPRQSLLVEIPLRLVEGLVATDELSLSPLGRRVATSDKHILRGTDASLPLDNEWWIGSICIIPRFFPDP